MTTKRRLSVTVDPDLLQAAEKAITEGKAATLSAWVNDALRAKIEHDRQLTALSEYIEEYEAHHGEITGEEMSRAARSARSRAIVVQGSGRGSQRQRKAQ
jgi:metal-responsive CopG/Arc/MetJ family transcriptional regulator